LPPQLDPTQLIVAGAFLLFAITVYGNLLGRIAREGGKVRTSEFAFPDLLVSMVLAGTLSAIVWRLATIRGRSAAPPVSITPEQILPNQLFYVILFIGIGGFLRWRGVKLSRVLGLDNISWPHALAKGVGLILAAFPLVMAVGAIVKNVWQEAGPEQELVTLFREVTGKDDYGSMLKIFSAGVIIAPMGEEFLFRGYFYGVFKRYLGGFASGLLTSALFATFHLNLASLPSLFVLALCFTMAYEASGSLLVPLSMHALFNATQLLFLYWQAQVGPL
jgi:membrane protease YdiL (CAAX protease family)